MALNFPTTPTVGQQYPVTPSPGIPTYTWDGEKWIVAGTGSDTAYVHRAGDTMTGHLNLPENVSPAVAHAVRKDYVTTAIAAIPAPDLASKVSKTGDTMTGTLTVASGGSVNVTAGNVTANAGSVTAVHVVASGTVQANNLASGPSGYIVTNNGGYDAVCVRANLLSTPEMYMQAIHQVGVRYFWRFFSGGPYFDFRSEGDASSQNGGPWVSYSDARIKTVVGDYESGLEQVVALKPVRYTFNGNETDNPPDQPIGTDADGKPLPRTGEPGIAPYETSGHYPAAISGREFIGLVAQDAEVPMPETVTKTPGYIDGEAVTDLRLLDTGPILFALINAVKELKARVEELEAAP